MGKECKTSECASSRRTKRRKLSHRSNSLQEPVKIEPKQWSSSHCEVQPEIMEEMGVKKLADEASSEEKSSITPPPLPGCSSAIMGLNEENSNLPDDFFTFRASEVEDSSEPNYTERLSDEVMLMIFQLLPRKALIRCTMVCKRWKQIAYDESLWNQIDLRVKVLKPGDLGHALARGVQFLSLSRSTIQTPLFLPDSPFLEETKSKLKYVDLTMATIEPLDLAVLLETCESLQKVSLENSFLTERACIALGKNPDLDVLNLVSCTGLQDDFLLAILTGCQKLREVNLGWTSLTTEALTILTENICSSVIRLNLSGCRSTLTDTHVQSLVLSCPELVELDLSDASNLTSLSIDALCTLPKLEHIALSRCYNIPCSGYQRLGGMESLIFLDVIGTFVGPALEKLRKKLPNIGINMFLFSSIARPTIGHRTSSIWGLKVR